MSSGARAPAAPAWVGSAAMSAFWSFWLSWLHRALAAPTDLRLLAFGRGILPKAMLDRHKRNTHDEMGPVAVRSSRAPQILRPQRVRPRGCCVLGGRGQAQGGTASCASRGEGRPRALPPAPPTPGRLRRALRAGAPRHGAAAHQLELPTRLTAALTAGSYFL